MAAQLIRINASSPYDVLPCGLYTGRLGINGTRLFA
jgi:hypothetical protein